MSYSLLNKLLSHLSLFQKPPEHKCREIGQSEDSAVEANISCTQLYSESDVRIFILGIHEFVERRRNGVVGFDFNRNERVGIPYEEVHFYRRFVLTIEIQVISLFHKHVAHNVLKQSTLICPEVIIGAKVLL